MELGYSLLLSEYIAADAIDYQDCSDWQIVCPICLEPTFKVSRLAQSIHYLSHYRDDLSVPSGCENRVRSLSRKQIARHNAKSRDQLLRYFLSELQTGIARAFDFDRKAVKLLKKGIGPVFRRFFSTWAAPERLSLAKDQRVQESFAADIEHVRATGADWVAGSGLTWLATRRIALDIWLHLLLSGKSHESLLFLAASAAVDYALEREDREWLPSDPVAHQALSLLAHLVNDDNAGFVHARMDSGFNPDALHELDAILRYACLAALARIPYRDMLRERLEASES